MDDRWLLFFFLYVSLYYLATVVCIVAVVVVPVSIRLEVIDPDAGLTSPRITHDIVESKHKEAFLQLEARQRTMIRRGVECGIDIEGTRHGYIQRTREKQVSIYCKRQRRPSF